MDPLLSYIPASAKRILDCGCGDGQRGAALRTRGAAVTGLAENAAIADQASAHLDQIITLDPQHPGLPIEDHVFDCAVCDGLLARLPVPRPFVKEIARVLMPEGLFVLTVPNIQYYQTVVMLAEGRWDCFEGGLIPPEQIRFFTAYEIGKLLRENGFKVLRCGALEIDPPEALPRDSDEYCKVGRIRIGPLNETEYKAYRSRQYIVYATPSAG